MEKTYPCDICQKTFTRRSNLTRHVTNCHSVPREMRVNVKTEHVTPASAVPPGVESCSEVGLSSSPVGVYSCNICLQGFTLNSQLQAHVLEHEMEGSDGVIREQGSIPVNSVVLAGTKSEEITSSVEGLGLVSPCIVNSSINNNNNPHLVTTDHLTSVGPDVASSEVVVTTDVLNTEVVSSPMVVVNGVVHADSAVTTGLINDTITNTSSPPMSTLSVHHSTPYSCSICQRGFSQRSHLEAHVRIHSGERPYQCNQCGAAFSRRGNLVRHRLSHGGERKHKCTVCGRRFSQKSHLQVHLRIHTGEKPYKCDRCGYAFSRSGNLVRHRRANTNGKRKYSCVPTTMLPAATSNPPPPTPPSIPPRPSSLSTSKAPSLQSAGASLHPNSLVQQTRTSKCAGSSAGTKGSKNHTGSNNTTTKNNTTLRRQQIPHTTSNTATTASTTAAARISQQQQPAPPPTTTAAANSNVVQLASVPYQIMTAVPSSLNTVSGYHSLANVPHQLVTLPQPISVHQLASLGNITSIPLHLDVPTT